MWPGAVGPFGPPRFSWEGRSLGKFPSARLNTRENTVSPSCSLGGDEAVAHVPDGPAPQQDCDTRPRGRACSTGPSVLAGGSSPAGPPTKCLYWEPLVGPAHTSFCNCPLKSLLKKESFFPSFQKILKITKNVNKNGKTVPRGFQ